MKTFLIFLFFASVQSFSHDVLSAENLCEQASQLSKTIAELRDEKFSEQQVIKFLRASYEEQKVSGDGVEDLVRGIYFLNNKSPEQIKNDFGCENNYG
jgi:hypothetical protein